MKRTILIILILGLLVPFSRAQLWKMKRWEAAGGTGTTHFFGDIGGFSKTQNVLGFRNLSLSQTRVDLNFNIKYRISQSVNVRVSFTNGFFHATDDRGSNESRGFEAFTSFFEPALLGEYYFIKNKTESSYLFNTGRGRGFGGLFKSLDFYVFTGIGGLSYSVRGNNDLTNYGMNNGGFTAVLPVGFGTTLVYSPDFNFGIEFGGRYSFSDNLDGYTSKYSSSNDVYYLLNFTITYKLKTGPNGLPSFR